MILKTKRLLLRPWKESDAPSLYQFACNPKIGPIAGWPPHQSVAESKKIIQNVLCGEQAYAICLKENDIPVGAIELKLIGHSDLVKENNECELGYWIGESFWGQGLVPEACQELLRYAFEELEMEKVWCGYYDGNHKSKRVQQKVGFHPQYTLRDVNVPLMKEKRICHVSCITKKEWKNQKSC